MNHPTFSERFHKIAKNIPDLERLISRIHAGRCKQSDFLKVMSAFKKLNAGFSDLASLAKSFNSSSVDALLRGAPDMSANLKHILSMYELLDDGACCLYF
jgi:DNA mismatch repair protein MSH6